MSRRSAGTSGEVDRYFAGTQFNWDFPVSIRGAATSQACITTLAASVLLPTCTHAAAAAAELLVSNLKF